MMSSSGSSPAHSVAIEAARAQSSNGLPERLSPARTRCRVAIVQSNYIPWKGYFDLIASVDKFVLLDSVQFTKGDWRNRNRIKTPHGTQWLTIPVRHKGRMNQLIEETEVVGGSWAARHWKSLSQNYKKAPFFDLYRDLL